MKDAGTIPEFECFDVGIVRSVGMYVQTGMYTGPLEYNFVMGVASGMPADPDLLPILIKLKRPEGALAGHRDRPRRNLAAAPALRRSRRPSALGAGGYVLSRRRHEGDLERPTGRSARRLRAPRGPRDRDPGGSAEDFWGEALSRHPSLRAKRSNPGSPSGSLDCSRFAPRNDGGQLWPSSTTPSPPAAPPTRPTATACWR